MALLYVALILSLSLSCNALSTMYYALNVTAIANEGVGGKGPSITIDWTKETCTTAYPCTKFKLYKNVYDRTALVQNQMYGYYSIPLLVSFTGDKTHTYVDTNVTVGTVYEYKLERYNDANVASTFIMSGIKVPVLDYNGIIIFLIEKNISISLAAQLQTMEEDMIGEGWSVKRLIVAATDSVPSVKAQVYQMYKQDRNNTVAVYIFGHVPVPYAGCTAPDGHSNHIGAWPADMYYGDVSDDYVTTWSDTIDYTAGGFCDSVGQGQGPRQNNLKGDGKFDTSYISGVLELQVGRVDLSQMSGGNETYLLSNYLKKNHAFRHGISSFARRGMVRDTFGEFSGEAFAGNGYRAFNVMFGSENVLTYQNNDPLYYAKNNSFLYFYGSGSGSPGNAGGVGSTNDYNVAKPQFAFTMQFGSWFGDWDVKDNFLRAPLAYGSALTDIWGARPGYNMHYMALGMTIGRSAWEEMNQGRQTYMALMGDPTLRLFIVPPVTGVETVQSKSSVKVTWTASADKGVVGYYVYRASGNITSPFTRVSSTLVTSTSFSDQSASAAAAGHSTSLVYMVRAVKLEVTPSGSYYNPSQGVFSAVAFDSGISSGVAVVLPSVVASLLAVSLALMM